MNYIVQKVNIIILWTSPLSAYQAKSYLIKDSPVRYIGTDEFLFEALAEGECPPRIFPLRG
jgi:hypothetical protein